MAPIKEPIDFDTLPNNVGELKAIIWRVVFQKNAIIKERDEHVNKLLDEKQTLQCSLQLCRESLAAADAASLPASASEQSESKGSGSTAPSSPHSPTRASFSSDSDSDSLSDYDDDNEMAGGMGSSGSEDLDNDEHCSDMGSGTSANLDSDEHSSGTEREALPDLDDKGYAGETAPRTSPTPSIRSRTSGSSRVSKTPKRGRSKGKSPVQAIGRAGRRRVWPYSGGEIDLTDVMEGV